MGSGQMIIFSNISGLMCEMNMNRSEFLGDEHEQQ